MSWWNISTCPVTAVQLVDLSRLVPRPPEAAVRGEGRACEALLGAALVALHQLDLAGLGLALGPLQPGREVGLLDLAVGLRDLVLDAAELPAQAGGSGREGEPRPAGDARERPDECGGFDLGGHAPRPAVKEGPRAAAAIAKPGSTNGKR